MPPGGHPCRELLRERLASKPGTLLPDRSRKTGADSLTDVVALMRATRNDREASRRLLDAVAAAMGCRDADGRFPDAATIAKAIETRGSRHGLDRVTVATTDFVARTPLALYLIEDEWSPDRLQILVALSERKFMGVNLKHDGEVERFAMNLLLLS